MFFRVFLLVFFLNQSALLAGPFEISLEPKSSVITKLGAGSGKISNGTYGVTAHDESEGGDSICYGESGKNKQGDGFARISPITSSESTDSLQFKMEAEAKASNGFNENSVCHQRPENKETWHVNTEATSSVIAQANVSIKFKDSGFAKPYFVIVEASNGEKVEISGLNENQSNSLDKSPHPIVYSNPEEVIKFLVKMNVIAKDSFGFKNFNRAESSVRVSLMPAPLLFGYMHSKFIMNGAPTNDLDYNQVGVILLGGLPHCTATLISKFTLVTAAHCVTDEYMSDEDIQLGKVKVLFAKNYRYPNTAYPAIEIAGREYPKDPPRIFIPESTDREHDIALIHLKSPIKDPQIIPSKLHQGIPSWDKIIADKKELIFVGYGYNSADKNNREPGIRRKANWRIAKQRPNAVAYYSGEVGTCKGDSGGPSYIIDNGRELLTSVTSGGADGVESCTFGVNTRIDSYLTWINARIKN